MKRHPWKIHVCYGMIFQQHLSSVDEINVINWQLTWTHPNSNPRCQSFCNVFRRVKIFIRFCLLLGFFSLSPGKRGNLSSVIVALDPSLRSTGSFKPNGRSQDIAWRYLLRKTLYTTRPYMPFFVLFETNQDKYSNNVVKRGWIHLI